MVERINYEQLPQIVGPYVHATKHNQTLYISGLTAYGTHAQSSDISAQTQEILNQLLTILELEKRSRSDIVKVTIFVKDITMLATIRQELFQFYEGNLPACSLVEISQLIHPDLLIEFEAAVAL